MDFRKKINTENSLFERASLSQISAQNTIVEGASLSQIFPQDFFGTQNRSPRSQASRILMNSDMSCPWARISPGSKRRLQKREHEDLQEQEQTMLLKFSKDMELGRGDVGVEPISVRSSEALFSSEMVLRFATDDEQIAKAEFCVNRQRRSSKKLIWIALVFL